MQCRIAHKLFLTDIPEPIKNQVMAELTLENPKWLENLKMGRTNYKVSRHLKFYSTRTNGGLILPRGYGGPVGEDLRGAWARPVEYKDERRSLPEVDFTFGGELRPYQGHRLPGHAQAPLRKPCARPREQARPCAAWRSSPSADSRR